MTIRSFPMAQNLYKKYCQLNSVSALKDIFNQEDDFLSQAEFILKEGIEVCLMKIKFLNKIIQQIYLLAIRH